LRDLYGDFAAQARVSCPEHLAHASVAEQGFDLIGAERDPDITAVCVDSVMSLPHGDQRSRRQTFVLTTLRLRA
jgi:hypothetical protein